MEVDFFNQINLLNEKLDNKEDCFLFTEICKGVEEIEQIR